MQWALNQLYTTCAWAYDAVAWSVSGGLWHRWAQAAIPFVQGRVLEVGCGTGWLQHRLAQTHYSRTPTLWHVGLDVSRQMLAHTRQRLFTRQLDAPLVRANALALPFVPHTFDTIVATFPAPYIIHPQTLAECRRVLVSGGRFVVVDGAAFTRSGIYERFIDALYRVMLHTSVRQHHTADTQTMPFPYATMIEQAGFALSWHHVTVAHSMVWVMIGHTTDGT